MGSAAKAAEEKKKRVYDSLLNRYVFVPVAVVTLGVWNAEGLRLIKSIGQKIARVSGESRSTLYLIQRLSLAVQRGNVASVLGTLPPGRELDEIFYL